MRIAFFLGDYPFFSNGFIYSQIEGLRARGHELFVYAERQTGPPPAEIPVAYEEMPESPWARCAGLLERRWSSSWLPALNPFRFGLDALSLRSVWSAAVWPPGNFDFLIGHFGPLGRKAVLLRDAGRVQGKVVTFFHGDDISAYPARFRHSIYAPLFARGDLFLTVSEYGRRQLLQSGCPAARTRIHCMGVDLELFRREESRAPGAELRFASVARLVPVKGLLAALAALARLRVPFRYVIAGDGPQRTELDAAVRNLGLQDRVEFAGVLAPAAVARLLRESDVFLLPSHSLPDGTAEGIPVALMEAMACELTVISTRHAGIPELIEDGENGLLVNERDPAALAAAIEAAADPVLRARLGPAARATVRARHDAATLNGQLQELLLELSR